MTEARQKAPGAVTSLVLGILGILICGLLAPFAWNMGLKAERAAASGDYDGAGMATAGKVLGIVGTVFLAIAVVTVIVAAVTGNL